MASQENHSLEPQAAMADLIEAMRAMHAAQQQQLAQLRELEARAAERQAEQLAAAQRAMDARAAERQAEQLAAAQGAMAPPPPPPSPSPEDDIEERFQAYLLRMHGPKAPANPLPDPWTSAASGPAPKRPLLDFLRSPSGDFVRRDMAEAQRHAIGPGGSLKGLLLDQIAIWADRYVTAPSQLRVLPVPNTVKTDIFRKLLGGSVYIGPPWRDGDDENPQTVKEWEQSLVPSKRAAYLAAMREKRDEYYAKPNIPGAPWYMVTISDFSVPETEWRTEWRTRDDGSECYDCQGTQFRKVPGRSFRLACVRCGSTDLLWMAH